MGGLYPQRMVIINRGVGSFNLLNCETRDAEIVAGAWGIERINRRYARHQKVLAERPGSTLRILKSAICNLKSSEA